MAPMVGGGERMGGLKAKPGGAPASTTQFVDLASDPAALSVVEIGPTKGSEAETGPEKYLDGPRRHMSSSPSSVKELVG